MAGLASDMRRQNSASFACRWHRCRARLASFHGRPPILHFNISCSFNHLNKISIAQEFLELFIRQRQDVLCRFLELVFFDDVNVCPVTLGEPIHEERPVSAPENNYCSTPSRTSLPRSGNPLLYYVATQNRRQSGPFPHGQWTKTSSNLQALPCGQNVETTGI